LHLDFLALHVCISQNQIIQSCTQPIVTYRTGKLRLQKLTNQENLPQPIFRTRILPALAARVLPQYRSIASMQQPLLTTVDAKMDDEVIRSFDPYSFSTLCWLVFFNFLLIQ
jgi:hypothetical protein